MGNEQVEAAIERYRDAVEHDFKVKASIKEPAARNSLLSTIAAPPAPVAAVAPSMAPVGTDELLTASRIAFEEWAQPRGYNIVRFRAPNEHAYTTTRATEAGAAFQAGALWQAARTAPVGDDAKDAARKRAAAVVRRLAHPSTLSDDAVDAVIDYFGIRSIDAARTAQTGSAE